MNIVNLSIKDAERVNQCDRLFTQFLDSEGKYDENYLKQVPSNSFIQDLSDNNNILLAAIQENIVIGFLYGYIESKNNFLNPVAHLCFLYVDEKHRNKKVATHLIDTFLNQMTIQNIKLVEVKSFAKNILANKLYEKYGFQSLWSNYRKTLDT